MKKVLLIDDSLTFRNAIKKILESIDPKIKVYEAENGKDGFHMLTEQSFDRIFTDLEMEGSDGRAFLEKIMGNKILSKKNITILSSDISSDLKQRFKDNKNITFINKATLAIMSTKIAELFK